MEFISMQSKIGLVDHGRAKSASFHPTEPRVTAALYDGAVIEWDYVHRATVTMGGSVVLHSGAYPVRAVNCHQAITATAFGDDHGEVQVHEQRVVNGALTIERTVIGKHRDYVRSVQFHPTLPHVLLTASDDATAVLWDWRAKEKIAELEAHEHYVMCAQFHPTNALVLTASLDQEVWVWDVSDVKKPKKKFSFSPGIGVNWAAFHPTKPLIATANDRGVIHLWSYDDTSATKLAWWLVHKPYASCVAFHPTRNVLFSCGEDGNMCVFDLDRLVLIYTHHEAGVKMWHLAFHPSRELLALSHDNGVTVLKTDLILDPYTVQATSK